MNTLAAKKTGAFSLKSRRAKSTTPRCVMREIRNLIREETAPLKEEIASLKAFIEDMEDNEAARIVRNAPAGERFPSTVAERLVAGDHPLKVFREYREMTQQQLADLAGTNVQYVSQIERHTREAGKKLLPRLAGALAVDEDDLRP